MKDYVSYDEYGLVEARCMHCGEQIMGRSYIELPSRMELGKKVKVMALKRFGNCKTVNYELEDGSYISAMFCSDCEYKQHNIKELEDKIHRGWKLEGKKEHKKIKIKGRMK